MRRSPRATPPPAAVESESDEREDERAACPSEPPRRPRVPGARGQHRPSPSPGPRPIARHDVYRHPVVGGREVPETPWRRVVGKVKELLTSEGEREETVLDERLRRPGRPSRMNVIAVVSPKGGVGKTTTTWLVGDALADLGRLSVCAIDINPDYGTLGLLVPDARRSERTLANLLLDYHEREPPTAGELERYFSVLASGLRVLEAPADLHVMESMGAQQYQRLLELVERQIGTVILDCGTGLASPVARWAMGRADQVLIVTTPDWVTSTNVSAALRHLPAGGAILVLNQVRSGVAGDRQAIADHFATQAVEHRYAVPYDEQLRTMLDSGTYELAAPKRSTRLAIKRLAAQVGEELR